ncbi:hypothetical protein [Micromonospora carbonacea]|uniref:Glycosyltransferase sugar-binding region containing DXD motif-containing protein n=1 Tax=Micromonospora carbonacea TaxID=47853 RepID=A0A7H8XLB4_9ACTN|nr:hypothetical protein [Micromonospora carbonacea]MBB5825860.1 hypothetical protein [Micromonospora carbonacea]QLD25460.1 hypothetical protein HXZ27_15660 [Micromonospora carbonacea]
MTRTAARPPRTPTPSARTAEPAAAEELARRLRALACLPGPSATPTAWPCDTGLLDWLRRMTYPDLYTWAAEENLARRWIGGDVFGSRLLPRAPGFLAGVDVRRLAPHLVAPLLRRVSMTRPAPTAADLTPAALAADGGPVSTFRRDGAARLWGQPEHAPPLPDTTTIPHVVHGIWLGRPLPESNGFWVNYGAAADSYAGQVDFVLWTDIPRSRFDAARATPPAPAGHPDPLAPTRALLAWAGTHGIHLVSVAELFHANAPMTLHTPYALELNRRLPQGFAAASDHLRVEVVHRFGGLYADGDLRFLPDAAPPPAERADRPEGPGAEGVPGGGYRLFRGRWDGPPAADGPARLPDLFDRVAASAHGFTLHALTDEIVLNDVILAPAGHPALALWLEGARYNYLRDPRDLYAADTPEPADPDPPTSDPRAGSGPPVAGASGWHGEPASWTWAVTAMRTGRVHHWLLARLGIGVADLVRPAPAVRGHSELSWLPPVDGQPPVACPDPDPLPTLVACVDLLRWQHLSRAGDLCLTAVAPLVRGLPEPDTAWTALLLAFGHLSTDLGPVTSVTDRRRNQDQTLDVVTLPPEAEALLDRSATPVTWFGSVRSGDDPEAAAEAAGREHWFLGERTVPARLLPAAPHGHPGRARKP